MVTFANATVTAVDSASNLSNHKELDCVHRSPKENPPSLKLWRAKVEVTGIEPVSKHILQKLSTCLFCFEVSGINWTRLLRLSGSGERKQTTD